MEYNAGAGINLVGGKEALNEYYSNLYSLCPVEDRGVPNTASSDFDERRIKVTTVGGVCAMVKDSVRLFTLGSASRGIPHKEWEIPLPVADPADYTHYPGADVIAFVELQGIT